MKIKKRNISFLFIFMSLVYWQTTLSGQESTMYYMGSVSQSYYLNPATQPHCNVFIGFGLPYLNAKATTGSLSTSNLIWADPVSNATLHPLSPDADVNDFLAKLEDVENFGVENAVSFLSFGFRAGEMYFSLDASVKTNASVTYPKDFMRFALLGNSNEETFDFSDLSLDAMSYLEVGLNISRRFGDQLQVGVRPKFLVGLGTLSSLNNNTELYTSTDEWILTADYQARIAASGIDVIPVDEEGILDSDSLSTLYSDLFDEPDPAEIWSNVKQNKGFGIDLGAHYKPIDRLQISLSVLDLGYIKWDKGTNIISANGSYTYTGLTYDSISLEMESELPEFALLDSLKENLSVSGDAGSFKSKLTPKLMVGARYFLTPGFDVGVLSRTEFYTNHTNQDVLLLANWHPHHLLSVSASYSVISNTGNNIGVGLGFKPLGILGFYLIFENMPLQYDEATIDGNIIPIPAGMNGLNVKFGMNLTFGCNQKKKLKQDKPLFNSTNWMF